MNAIIPNGTKVKIIEPGYSYTTYSAFYQRYANDNCYPYYEQYIQTHQFPRSTFDYKNEIGVIVSSGQYESNANIIYIVNMERTVITPISNNSYRYAILISAHGLEVIKPVEKEEAPLWQITIKPDSDKWNTTRLTKQQNGNVIEITVPRSSNDYNIDNAVARALEALDKVESHDMPLYLEMLDKKPIVDITNLKIGDEVILKSYDIKKVHECPLNEYTYNALTQNQCIITEIHPERNLVFLGMPKYNGRGRQWVITADMIDYIIRSV